jgi:hypothetical protein
LQLRNPISDATAAFLLLRNLLESRVKLDSGMGYEIRFAAANADMMCAG